jgi:hypothetical protein
MEGELPIGGGGVDAFRQRAELNTALLHSAHERDQVR